MRPLLAVILLLLALPAAASEEEIHPWRSAAVVAPTGLFGDVEVRATGDASGRLRAADVVVKGKTLTLPAAWLATLPPMPLASLEVRSERGYDPEPWLYLVFASGPRSAAGTVTVHLAIQGGKLRHASIGTSDGKGGSTHATRPAP